MVLVPRTLQTKVRRARKINGVYFLKEELGQFDPLRKSQMADTVLQLTELSPQFMYDGVQVKQWAPLTRSLSAYYAMLPDKGTISQSEDCCLVSK